MGLPRCEWRWAPDWTIIVAMDEERLKLLSVCIVAGTAIVTIHGTTSKNWHRAHTVFSALGILAWIVSRTTWLLGRLEQPADL